MKKSKKLLALLTALSISATAFAGLATTAFADGAGTEEDPYYKIDFEGDSEGQKVKGYDGDTSPNITNIQSDDGLVTYFVGSGNRQAGNISVANDATMGHYASINAMRFADAESTNKRAPSIKINSPRALDQVSAGKAYVFKFDYKINAKKSAIFINNDDDQPSGDFIKLLMTDIPTDKWLTAYAEFDTEKKMCSVETYDGETLINEQANFYTATGSPSRLRFTSYDNATYNYCIDNITVFERTPTVKYQVTYKTWGDVESKEVVKADQKPAAVPDPETKGKIFKGWKKDGAEEPLYTTEQVKDMAITSDAVFEGVYEDDPEYRQSIANVEFVAKEENVIGNPESPDADEVYTYTVKVTSDIGNDITDACDIEWSIVGEETDDNYVTLAQKPDEPKTATLTIKNGVSNYFGYITAKAVYTPKPYEVAEPGEGITFQRKLVDGEAKNIVTVKNSEANANLAAATLIYAEYTNKGALETLKTYPLTFTNGVATQEMPDAKNDAKLMVWKKISGEGEGVIEPLCPAAKVSGADTEFVGPTTETVQVPYAIIGKPDSTGNIYPTAGYPTDYSLYADSIVGYKATSDGLNTKDLVLGEWSIYGSLATRDLELVKDETTGKKSLKFSTTGGNRGGTGSSALGVYQWASQEEQYTIEMTLKGNASVAVANTTVNNTHIEECGYSISGGNLTAGGETISGIDAGAFYKILMSCDPTAKKYYVKVYDLDGELVGETPVLDCPENEGNAEMKYLCISGTFPVELQTFRVYKPTINALTINADEVVQIPEASAPEADCLISAICTDANGDRILGDVEWSIEGETPAGVTLTGSGQTAHLKVANTTAPGSVTVKAVCGSAQQTMEIALSNSGNSVKTTATATSITIPFEDSVENTYTAKTVNKAGEDVTPDEITWSYLQKDGSTPLAALPSGITFDSATGKLTVDSTAKPITFYLKAKNTEGLSSKILINIHGTMFQFGSGEAEEGYTLVDASQMYAAGSYGFEKTTGLTASADGIKGSDAYKFKVDVPNGNYRVQIETTSAAITFEDIPGVANAITGSKDFVAAVCDGTLDLNFDKDSTISKLTISQDKKTALASPAVYAIGDSTTKNAGHYSGYDPDTATDHREYASWGNCVTEDMYKGTFSSFRNDGMAGRNSTQFYQEGRINAVLTAIAPGDYVTVNMGINGTESNEVFTTIMGDYCVKAIIDRGAIPVIVTATPDGPVGSSVGADYNASTGKFTNNRGTGARNGLLRKIAQDNNLNIIELGYWGQDWMNTLTMDDIGLANTANKNVAGYKAPSTVLEIVQSWYTDHNHYTKELGTIIANHMFDCLKTIHSGSDEFNQAKDPHIGEQ